MKRSCQIEGLRIYKGYLSRTRQVDLVRQVASGIKQSPLFTPTMPRWGTPFSVRMTNFGTLGWVSDKSGYRYQPNHPEINQPWVSIPPSLFELWNKLSNYPKMPEACLVNIYTQQAKMGLHQDNDEADLSAPVLSISLGDAALFRIGGHARKDPTRSFKLESGDIVLLDGSARLAFHGIDRLYPNTSTLFSEPAIDQDLPDLLKNGGRINLTLRRVNS